MKIATIIARVLLGLPFLIFGINHFFPFIPHPEMHGAAVDYMTGLTKAGYFWPILRSLEILIGAALISGYFVPLALAILAPINLQILLFHLILEPQNVIVAIVLALLQAFLIYRYWAYYKQMFVTKAELV
ncbi:MAG: DoxX family membrane protein [Leadbetterella sp.]